MHNAKKNTAQLFLIISDNLNVINTTFLYLFSGSFCFTYEQYAKEKLEKQYI